MKKNIYNLFRLRNVCFFHLRRYFPLKIRLSCASRALSWFKKQIFCNRHCNLQKGSGLIEALVGVSVASSFIFSMMFVSQLSQKIIGESVKNIQTSFLLEEGVDALKILRDTSWNSNINSFATGADYYFYYDGVTWMGTTSNYYIDGIFERKFRLDPVYRDANDDISGSGTLDGGAKKATVNVSRRGRMGTTTQSASFYLTDLFAN